MSAAYDVDARDLWRRNRTFSMVRQSLRELRRGARAYPEPVARPRTTAECPPAAAICGHVGCAYHLALEVNEDCGSININAPFRIDPVDGVPELDLRAMRYTCALRAAAAGGLTFVEIARDLGITRQRVQQIEARAFGALRAELARERGAAMARPEDPETHSDGRPLERTTLADEIGAVEADGAWWCR